MREHPIPQDITGYRFHIVGNMTIKQFAQMGAGCLLAFLIYSTNLIDLLKWPLIVLSIGTGALVAFVPFEERPLDHWLLTFIKILYKPTKFYWKKTARIPDPFLFEPAVANQSLEEEFDLSPIRRQRIREYLASVKQGTSNQDAYEQWQTNRVAGIMETFTQVSVRQTIDATTIAKPDLKIRMRGLSQFSSTEQSATQTTTQSTPNLGINQSQEQLHATYGLGATFDQAQLAAAAAAAETENLLTKRSAHDTQHVANQVIVPEQTTIQIDHAHQQSMQERASVPHASNDDQTDPTQQAGLNGNQSNHDQTVDPTQLRLGYYQTEPDITTPLPTQATTFNTNLPFPAPPTEPNKLVGMVLSPTNDLINDAIIEIKNQNAVTVRAIKTNALGQFFVTTPLSPGIYSIETEKDGWQFPILSLELTDQIVAPIEIRSTNTPTQTTT